MSERLVVIGGDAAGMSAASQVRRRHDKDEFEILAFERGDYTSYSACGIPYYVGNVVEEFERLIARSPEEHRERGIDVRVRHEVTSIDLDARKVTVRDLERERDLSEGFDHLMIATGAVPIRPPLDGIDSEGIFGVQTLNHGSAIKRWIDEVGCRRAVVVGGGYIGLEMAEAFINLEMEVALVDQAPQPMSTLDADMGEIVADGMRGMGIDVHVGEKVEGFETKEGRVTSVVTDQHNLPADIVLLGIGVRPNAKLASTAGVPIGPSGAIAVDRTLRTKSDGVWSAGDCAEKFHRVSRKPVAIALGTHANKEGRIAGINIAGGYEAFPGVLGTAATKVCDMDIARTGLSEREADDAGFEFESVVVDSTTRAGYYPGASPIRTKMTVEKQSGRLLGAQIVGKEGAAKRIDAIAVALWAEMTVDEMLNLDLSYAPPHSPVWDPVLVAARKAWTAVEGGRRSGN